jgi:hypothetical protein
VNEADWCVFELEGTGMCLEALFDPPRRDAALVLAPVAARPNPRQVWRYDAAACRVVSLLGSELVARVAGPSVDPYAELELAEAEGCSAEEFAVEVTALSSAAGAGRAADGRATYGMRLMARSNGLVVGVYGTPDWFHAGRKLVMLPPGALAQRPQLTTWRIRPANE